MGVQATKSNDQNTLTVKINGRFDFSMHKDFRDAYNGEPHDMNYVVDMSQTDYMDSSALGMLLMLREHVGDAGGTIRLAGCQPAIKQVLEISNFSKLFEID